MSQSDLLCVSHLLPTDPTVPSATNPTRLISSYLHDPETHPISPQSPTGRTSWQLSRWSRVRSIRSHRRLGFPALNEKTGLSNPPMISSICSSCSSGGDGKEQMDTKMNGPDVLVDVMNQGKQIYMVSDGTGSTVEHSVYATLEKLNHCHPDAGCSVKTKLFSGVEDMEILLKIIKQAARDDALLLYTLKDPTIARAAKQACQRWGVHSTDILQPTSEVIAEHLGVSPSAIPTGDPGSKPKLAEDYSRLMHEAVDFTLKHDDGARTEDLNQADIVLVGVSRTGKTPLSIYLAQKGYKVANVPIVAGMDVPRSLFEMDQEKIFGLTVNPTVLQQVRLERAKELGFLESNYSEMDHVRRELDHALKIFVQNPSWPVIDVTGKAMEETAAVIVRMYNDKKKKRLMPLISKRY